MKRNVDLTLNRIFSNVSQSNELLDTLNNLSRFPWIDFNSGTDVRDPRKQLIITGNRENRKKMRQYQHMDSPNWCDCCGERMNLIPWDRELGVCKKCTKYYESYVDKCIWRNKDFSYKMYK